MSNGNQPKFSMRPVVLVFHDSASDIKFLQALKYDVAEAKNVLEIVDTRDMYQHGAAANQPPGLERVLTELNIPYRYLHNAGNDAVYTLQAMISLAFRSRHESLERDRVSRRNGQVDCQLRRGVMNGLLT
jgi:DNA polymerase III alpha subunit (gram-positive type)